MSNITPFDKGKNRKINFEVTEREMKLILLLRQVGFGSVERIMIQEGQPVVAETIRYKVDLFKDNI